MKRYDVIVIGGGTAGVVAAIQSAKEGAKTLLVERSERLGGTMTNGGVAWPGLFYAWKKQIISGIGWELVVRCAAEEGTPLPDFSKQEAEPHSHWQVPLNGDLWALLCDEAVTDAGAEVLFDAMPAKIAESETEKTVTVCTKTGLREFSAKVLVDCTGDANAVCLAGYPQERSGHPQPATYRFSVSGYDFDSLDLDAIRKAYDRAVAEGKLQYTDVSWDPAGFAPRILQKYGGGQSHVRVGDEVRADESEGRTEVNLSARLAILRLYRFLRSQPGLEKIRLGGLMPECGIRETVRIRGKETVTCGDYVGGRRFPDAVCYSFYPVDLHTASGAGLDNIVLKEGVVPTVPRGALLPDGSRNFLVAGRCLSSDQLANSALRVQATCMATGQAAGALAAIAVKTGREVSEIPMEELYRVLRKHGAIVPD